jgi:hypothetical protein
MDDKSIYFIEKGNIEIYLEKYNKKKKTLKVKYFKN